MGTTFFNNKLEIFTGDITKVEADVIVNAANSSLMGGGGVDGAIHKAGGPKIKEECIMIRKTKYPNGLPVGEVVETTAGDLKAKYVFHTVGPIWYGGHNNEDILLKNCYVNSLKLAEKLNCKSIAFPAISTGVYGFPLERASKIVSQTIKDYYNNGGTLNIKLVFFTSNDYSTFINNSLF